MLLLSGAFALIPAIARVLPDQLGNAVVIPSLSTSAEDSALDVFALTDLSFDLSPGTEFEDETPIPVPEPGEDDLPVFSKNLCWYADASAAALYVINRTGYSIDLADYLKKAYPVTGEIPSDGEPLVLIVHTHGSESYLKKGYEFYSSDETFRSTDEENTVVHIGEVLCGRLNELGVPTLHDSTMYDTVDFNKSYVFSRAGIIQALTEHPSIKYVIDLHRDSIFSSDSENIKPVTEIENKKCAQIMIVAGTDEGGAEHPDWKSNLTVAAYLQQKLNTLYPTLARPVNIRSAAFNQALAKGSLLLEVGSCGNTIEEAENAILFFAEAYSQMIKEHS